MKLNSKQVLKESDKPSPVNVMFDKVIPSRKGSFCEIDGLESGVAFATPCTVTEALLTPKRPQSLLTLFLEAQIYIFIHLQPHKHSTFVT